MLIWKVPEKSNDACSKESVKLCNKIESELPKYHTRAMFRKATMQWIWLKKVSYASLITLYKTFSGDASKVPDNETAELLLEKINNGENIEDVSEMMNCSYKDREGQFDEFWDEAENILIELCIPDERRKDSALYKSRSIRSIFHLKELTVERLKLKNKSTEFIPSEEWIRLQFTPSNKWANTSKKYTARFNTKFSLQTRLLRKFHPDHKFGCVLFNYFKAFSVRHRHFISMSFLDDKCSIPIGHYDSPVLAVQRQRQKLDTGISSAADHDHIAMHLTPSVINIFEKPPRNITESFYGGTMHVVLKCAIFEPSSPKRHMVELEYSASSSGLQSPIQMIYTGGG